MKSIEPNLRKLRRRILGVLLLAVLAIYALVRAAGLDARELLGYLGASVVLVAGTALVAFAVVALVKLLRR